MKEIIEFRLNDDYGHLLLEKGEKKEGGIPKVVLITRDDPRFLRIKTLYEQIREKENGFFFLYSTVRRDYTKDELSRAGLFHLKISKTFEPAGEECGTLYDETTACELCGSGRKQVGPLRLRKNSIPDKDIARTIAGEVVVSEKFAEIVSKKGLKGVGLSPIMVGNLKSDYYQLGADAELDLSGTTVAGVNVFDFTEANEGSDFTIPNGYQIKIEKEIYKCPKGHTIGLNIISELYIKPNKSTIKDDFFATKQKIGVRRGLLRPEPLYVCSPALRKMVIENKLRGFDFEVVHIENS